LPAAYRPSPAGLDRPDVFDGTNAPKVLVCSDSAGATHTFAKACREAGVGFSFGFAVTAPVKEAIVVLGEAAVPAHFDGINVWADAVNSDGSTRDGAWIADATALVDLSAWPIRTRLILRKERPHPGAQLRFTDLDGHRITAFITDTPAGVVPGQLAGLDLRHRQHARVEDRIRQAKETGLRNLPCFHAAANAAWLEIVMTATDLIAWTKLLGFTEHPELARCEIATFRYRVLHVAARITRGARQIRLRLDTTWRWAPAIADAWAQIRAAFTKYSATTPGKESPLPRRSTRLSRPADFAADSTATTLRGPTQSVGSCAQRPPTPLPAACSVASTASPDQRRHDRSVPATQTANLRRPPRPSIQPCRNFPAHHRRECDGVSGDAPTDARPGPGDIAPVPVPTGILTPNPIDPFRSVEPLTKTVSHPFVENAELLQER